VKKLTLACVALLLGSAPTALFAQADAPRPDRERVPDRPDRPGGPSETDRPPQPEAPRPDRPDEVPDVPDSPDGNGTRS
jgi:hypothetical protein